MITISNSVRNIDAIRQQHTDAALPVVESVVKFYINVFECIQSFSSNAEAVFTKEITDVVDKSGIGFYKRLLNQLLDKKGINNKGDLVLLRSHQRRKNRANATHVIIPALKSLNRYLKEIIECDLTNTNQLRSYQIALRRYDSIAFLFPMIFDYENWFSLLEENEAWGPYQLCSALKLDTCPYCNRQYTFTILDVNGRKVARPELDHFLPKKDHPMLAISFYNLIPSCSVCNGSIKGAQDINHLTHLSPYATNPDHKLMRFTYFPKTYEASIGLSEDLLIEAQYAGNPADTVLKTRVEGNISLFCLNDVYKNHTDTVKTIIRLRHMSGDRHIYNLQQTYKNFSLSMEEAYMYAYGNYYAESSFYKRPLSKLTKDIAFELSALKDFNDGTTLTP